MIARYDYGAERKGVGMSSNFAIRRYDPGEESAVAALMAGLQDFERGLSDDRPPGEGIGTQHFRYLLQECREKQGRVFVAEQESELVGFVVVLVERLDEGDLHVYSRYKSYGEVTDLFVLPAHRGQGIARALLNEAEDYCRSLSLSRLRIQVLARNRDARDFYHRAGYVGHELIYSTDL